MRKIVKCGGNTGLMILMFLTTLSCASYRPPAGDQTRILNVPEFQSQRVTFAASCHQRVPAFAFQLTADFSPRQAYLMLLAAYLSHLDTGAIERQLQRWEFNDYQLLGPDRAGAYGYIAEHRRFVLLAFRGTETVLGGRRNIELLLRPADAFGIPGNVHSGYQKLLQNFRDDILTMLSAEARTKPVFITGHSLGGALAIIAAMSLQLAGYPVTAVYSFGQPRVGDEQFRRMVVQHLGERYYRIDTPEDVTPHLPPTRASAQAFARLLGGNNAVTQLLLTGPVSRLGYASHAGQGYWLAGDGSVIAHGPETGEEEIAFWRSAIDDMGDLSLLPTDWMAFAGKRFSSHAPAFYLCRLAQSVAKMAGTELR